ncbi:ComEC/Rec2 family competence protein [Sphingomonas sp. 10B4]|uniref:ComEC/Rec2 family competence protein n=1 Tax=Sphingomonas sp. 10B4 TaxID=3048575 RepID=UPI002AB460CE|nr:MBL fold metallo-hydrolase [Sphingomonas sp. 10B4]MDY7526253.1 MBL fold metallo-hydrolase [Sphingomonas sp. 10B4]MEB0283473.1 MBL fold metallo-hydrolase [Sphingomonas sp. 10B4]
MLIKKGANLNRRSVLAMIGGGASAAFVPGVVDAASPLGPVLPMWQPGMLDIHHISTGRGNCALLIFPDGTTAMVDAGANNSDPLYMISPKPNGSRRAGEWLGRYAKRHLRAAGRQEIDYFILTHLHDDHMGMVYPGLPFGPDKTYRLTGVSDVEEIVPIRRFIDRDAPTYAYPAPQTNVSALNYIAFLKYQATIGKTVERFKPGSDSQINMLRNAPDYQGFHVRNLAANGEVWTGAGTETQKHFPDLASLKSDDYPTENMCSLALKVSYGKFDYYTGGDLSNFNNYGAEPWRDIETPVAQAAGPVEVAVVNHHGYADAAGPGFVSALRPKEFIIESPIRN